MTISRRLALGGVSAFAAVGSFTPSALASAAKHAAKKIWNYRNTQSAQSFIELLIHRDETKNAPVSAEVSIASTDTAWYAVDTLEGPQFSFTNTQYKKRGYRLRRVTAFNTRNGIRYSACWQLASGPDWHSGHGMKKAEFDQSCASYMQRGYRMTYMDARVNYAAIWELGDNTSQKTFSSLSLTEYQQQLATLSGQGLRPTRISLFEDKGALRVAAIFDQNTSMGWQSHPHMNAAEFQKTTASMKLQGYRMTDASGYVIKDKPYFSGIWEKA